MQTGTLTEEGLDVYGVLPSGSADTEVVQDISIFSERDPITQVLATCHSLTCIENQLCGDPLDVSMFSATGWVSIFFILILMLYLKFACIYYYLSILM